VATTDRAVPLKCSITGLRLKLASVDRPLPTRPRSPRSPTATRTAPFAEALVVLFDAIMSTLRWRSRDGA
jgi:hypothetical protein